MGHLLAEKSKFSKTDPRWLETGNQLARQANEWAGRDDIVAYVGPDAGHGVSVACFVPSTAEMEINVDQAFGEGIEPGLVPDLSKRVNQFDYPAVMGAVLHEAAHAKYSRFDLAELARVASSLEREVTTSFEETRIEGLILRGYPRNRAFLRACALDLVLNDVREDSEEGKLDNPALLAQLVLLSLARVDAGVLDADDVSIVQEIAERVYGKKMLQKMRSIWLRAQRHRGHYDYEPLLALAKEWIELFKEADMPLDSGSDGLSEEMAKAISDALDELLGEGGEGGALDEAAADAVVAGGDEAADQESTERAEALAKAKATLAEERSEAEAASERVFGAGTGPGRGPTNSKLYEERQPVGKERAAAVSLANKLEKARYHDRVVTRRNSAVPSGRLRSRAAVLGAAQKANGQVVTAEPWKVTKRFHTEDPELKVGLLVDISGSMRGAMSGMGSATWIISEAVRRIQGEMASVYYGNSAWVAAAPGQHLPTVKTYSAPDTTEVFDEAFKALDGKMQLIQGSGARVVFVISDLYYTYHERQAFDSWAKRMADTGVALVVAVPESHYVESAKDQVGRHGTVVIPDWSSPVDIANIIGEAALAALQNASRA